MLECTTSAPDKRFGLIVRHDDADREHDFDRESNIGTLLKGLATRRNAAGLSGDGLPVKT